MAKVKINKFETKGDWPDWVGKQIKKHSDKPFKSGAKIGTVKELTVNPDSERQAFIMLEDESIVDCHQCTLEN